MIILNNLLKYNMIKLNYNKIKINYLFLNNKFIIYLNDSYNNLFLNKLLKYKVQYIIITEKNFKQLFNCLKFSFLRNNLLCIFVNDLKLFFNIIQLIENKQFFYSYKNCLSNITISSIIIEEYNKNNINFFLIQLILKKKIIKVILLLLFFFLTFIKNIKKCF